MSRSLLILTAIALLSLSGCTRLRDWLAPFQGMNSDTGFYDPSVGQYSQPGTLDHVAPPASPRS